MITGTSSSLGPQPPADLEPVDARQHQVEHHQVDALVTQIGRDGLAVGRLDHLVLGGLQVGHDDLAHRRVVVDHQHPCHASSLPSTSAPGVGAPVTDP